jgi:hypothetical protein
VPAHRSSAAALAAAALLVVALPQAVHAFPLGRPAPTVGGALGRQVTTAKREVVASRGVYELSLTVEAGSGGGHFVHVEVGHLARRARIDGRDHRARLRLRLAIRTPWFTVRVTAAEVPPIVTIRLRRVGAIAAAGPAAVNVARPRSTAGSVAGGVTRSSSTGAAGRANGSPPASATGPSGSTAATGATAASGATGSTGTAAPPAPPVPVAAGGASGSSAIVVPPGLAPIAQYTNLVEDYEFSGTSLPAGWSAGTWSYGFSSTLFQPSQVTMTGSSVALTASDQAGGGYPYQSGWIDTEGAFSMNHGMVDFRAKMPAGQGLWSGLWLDQPDGSNPWGEIDVQEMLLGNTHNVYATLHSWAPLPMWANLQTTSMNADASQGFHDYQVIWQPGLITWAIDNVAYAQYTSAQAAAAGQPWPFDDGTGFYLVADLAVAGPADWGGPPDASTVFPASLQIQSVKVWE